MAASITVIVLPNRCRPCWCSHFPLYMGRCYVNSKTVCMTQLSRKYSVYEDNELYVDFVTDICFHLCSLDHCEYRNASTSSHALSKIEILLWVYCCCSVWFPPKNFMNTIPLFIFPRRTYEHYPTFHLSPKDFMNTIPLFIFSSWMQDIGPAHWGVTLWKR